MPQSPEPMLHVKPYVEESRGYRSLHFSIREVQSRMSVTNPCALDLAYSRTMMGFLLFKPEPKQLVMIGLGGGSLPKFCHRHLPAARIEVVEINPHVLALRETFLIPPDDERFAVRLGDGAALVRQDRAACDVLLVDGFDYDGQPPELCSQAFYDDCADFLQPDGILVVNLMGRDPDHESFLDRLRRSFSNELLVIDGAALGNVIVFAFKPHCGPVDRAHALLAFKRLERAVQQQLSGALSSILATLGDERRSIHLALCSRP